LTAPAGINRRNYGYYVQQTHFSTPILYERRLTAYIDIIGWSAACRDRDKLAIVAEAARRVNDLPRSFTRLVKGAVANPIHQATEVVTFSDNLAVSMPASLDHTLFFKFLTIVCRDLLTMGFLTRGGVTVGNLYHKENMIFGPALIDAVTLEKEAIYPRLVCSHVLMTDFENRNHDPNNPQVLVQDQLGRQIVNLLAFAEQNNPVAWSDLEKTIAENIDRYRRCSDPKCKDELEKQLEKWLFMRDVLKRMIQSASRR